LVFEADRLFRRACALQNRGNFHPAAGAFHAALSLYRRSNNLESQIETLLKLGDIHRQLESFIEARSFYRSAFRLTKKISRSNTIDQKRQDALVGEALCLRGEGNFSSCLTKFQSCLTYYKTNKDLEGNAYVLWAMGTTERFAGQFRDAQRHLEASLKIYQRLHDVSGTAYALCGLGGTYRMKGRPGQSLACYRRANTVFKKLHDKFGLAYSFCGQSNAYRMQNKIEQALPLMKQAERLYRSLKLKGPLAFVLWSQAQAYGVLKRPVAAQSTLSEATRLFSSVNDKRGMLYALLGKGWALYQQNNSNYQRVFKTAVRMAIRGHLPFEQAHALRFLNPKSAAKIYRRCGVDSRFFLYRTLP
jgi:tetratricopeptide (TPR) repeat protein